MHIVRNEDHPPEDTSDGTLIYSGDASWAIDRPLTVGKTLYYGFFATFSDTEPPQFRRDFAKVGSGAEEAAYESFTSGSDLSYTQILYTPVGEAASGGYTMTLRKGVRELPHSSENAQYVTLAEDDGVTWSFPQPFPFLGEVYDECWIAENGYIAFGVGSYLRYSTLNYPWGNSITQAPRICPAFADLSNVTAGVMWGKVLPDRSVMTYESLPEWGSYFYRNTAQVELFYSGHIRITCLELTANEIAVGVADGKGIVYDPQTILQSGTLVEKSLDISELSDGAYELSMEPISPVSVNEGMRAEFRIVTSSPTGAPTITVDGMPEDAELITVSPSERKFTWLTGYDDTGDYALFVEAVEGEKSVSQYVTVHVGEFYRAPEVDAVTITPADPSAGQALTASWSLYSPEETGDHYSYVEWYRNGTLMLPLLNSSTAPGFVTNEGDTWYCIVTPYTWFDSISAVGEPIASNVVTIGAPSEDGEGGGGDEEPGALKLEDVNGDNFINAVDVQLVINTALGVQLLPTADVNRDGYHNAVDVQMVVNGVLRP
jgi:hypothetical protein